ncbi:MAG: hypothetical protein OEY57_09525, partial [Nitrospirota bacterium]|nr:hypothetical protein [Nitrospirota bacterium]
ILVRNRRSHVALGSQGHKPFGVHFAKIGADIFPNDGFGSSTTGPPGPCQYTTQCQKKRDHLWCAI